MLNCTSILPEFHSALAKRSYLYISSIVTLLPIHIFQPLLRHHPCCKLHPHSNVQSGIVTCLLLFSLELSIGCPSVFLTWRQNPYMINNRLPSQTLQSKIAINVKVALKTHSPHCSEYAYPCWQCKELFHNSAVVLSLHLHTSMSVVVRHLTGSFLCRLMPLLVFAH